MKRIYNFYIDIDVKDKCEEKLERINGKRQKGQLSALVRVLLKRFADTPDGYEPPDILAEVDLEYETSLKLNKRSKL